MDLHIALTRRAYNHDFLSNIPIHLLTAELQRRNETTTKPSCGSTGHNGTYDVSAHVAALFLILIVSTLACSFPIIARRFPNLPIPHRFLFLSRHFGTGVLIATAFVHLLPTAFISMTNPCLPAFWSERYQPMAGFIAMIAVFAVVTIEMVFAMRGAGHTHDSEWNRIPGGGQSPVEAEPGRVALHTLPASSSHKGQQQKHESDHETDSDLDDLNDLDDLDAVDDSMSSEFAHLSQPTVHKIRPSHSRHESEAGIVPQDPQKMFLQCLLLEAGILFHSIFIGMAVSVAQGAQFVVLLIAISFHQTFEGFALGARIAALIPNLFDASSPKPWLMALAYGTTTPIGQALGLWLHRMYDPNSQVGLLMVGITNAISSGLLLFAGLVQLIAEDFLSDRSYKVLKGRRRVEASLAVVLGGLLMAVVGAFA